MRNKVPDRSEFLMIGALAYAVITFGITLAAISSTQLFSVLRLSMIFMPLLPICAMATARLQVRFHWAAMVGFVCWILTTTFVQLLMFAQAAASA